MLLRVTSFDFGPYVIRAWAFKDAAKIRAQIEQLGTYPDASPEELDQFLGVIMTRFKGQLYCVEITVKATGLGSVLMAPVIAPSFAEQSQN